MSDFTRVVSGMAVVDLGTGVGVVALSLARRMNRGRILAVETQARLAECARMNVRLNAGPVDIEVLEADWNHIDQDRLDRTWDLVVSNPPYFRVGTGRMNPCPEEAAARHEVRGSLATAAAVAGRLLSKGGLFVLSYPVSRMTELFRSLSRHGFEPKRIRLVHNRPEAAGWLTLVEARLGGGEELQVEAPLYVYDHDRGYSPEVRDIISGADFGGT